MLKITPNINNNRTSVGTVNFTEQQSFFVLLLQFVFTHSFSLICVRHLFLVASLPTYQCLHKTILHFIRLELCLWTYCQSCPGQCVCILGKVTTSTDAIKKKKKPLHPVCWYGVLSFVPPGCIVCDSSVFMTPPQDTVRWTYKGTTWWVPPSPVTSSRSVIGSFHYIEAAVKALDLYTGRKLSNLWKLLKQHLGFLFFEVVLGFSFWGNKYVF